MPQYLWICLNSDEYAWICLHVPTSICKKYWENYASSEKAVTTSETLTEYTIRSCTTIVSNKC